MKEKKGAVIKGLYEKLERSRGFDIKRSIDELKLSMGVLDGNFFELTQFIKDYEKNEDILHDGELDRKLSKEIVRLIQNYVASDYSYNEHAYKIVKKLDIDLLDDFKIERDKVRQDENVAFVRDLRRYSQHYSIIRQSTRISLTRVSEEKPLFDRKISVELTKEMLEEWSDWHSKAKEFIKKMDDQIKLIIPLAKQLKKIHELHIWLLDEIFERFKHPIAEYTKILDKMRSVQEINE